MVEEHTRAVRELVRRETRCLDNGDLESWIELFSEDGDYWMPLEPEHSDPEQHDSLIYDNHTLMRMRVHNMGNPLSPSMQHPVRSVRILSELDISAAQEDNADIRVDTTVIAVINHRQQDYYAGKVSYLLVHTDDGLRIRRKRVDLTNADAPLDVILIYI